MLLRSLERGDDEDILAVATIIARNRPDILLLTDFDYDHDGVALGAFAQMVLDLGVDYPHQFALRPNTGLATGLDLDGDGRTGGPGDAQGFGEFIGAQGMALMSRFPVVAEDVRDFSALLWKDLPGARLPSPMTVEARDIQRISSKGHWDVPVILPDGTTVHLLASHPTPPVFDWPDDRNGMRNRDEIRLWSLYLDGDDLADHGARQPDPFVILGDLNADPNDGEGSHIALRELVSHPLVKDPRPKSRGGEAAALRQNGLNLTHGTPASQDTVDWDECRTPGNMRVDYVLPSVDFTITDAGVFWPAPDDPDIDLVGLGGDVGSHHRLVWVDVELNR